MIVVYTTHTKAINSSL